MQIVRPREVRGGGGKGNVTTSLLVPIEIARQLPEDIEFAVEPTKEGLLYRPLKATRARKPRWLS